MVATVQIRRWTGSAGTPTKTAIQSINTRANAADAHTIADIASPIKIPSSGTNYSYWVATRLFASIAPTGVIDNVRWHTDGAAGFGTGVNANVAAATAYTQATGSVGTGNQLTTVAYTQLLAAPADAFSTYPNATTNLAVAGSISAATGDFANFVVYQITVASTAGPGATTPETYTWLYDET